VTLLHIAAVHGVVHQVQVVQLSHGEVGHAADEAKAEVVEWEVIKVLSATQEYFSVPVQLSQLPW